MKVDCQSDVEKYGRGISHITADLSDGDIIAYQDGTWYVDGLTEVGDGSPPVVRYMQVDAIQLVWTHSCEHGVVNGFTAIIENYDEDTGATIERGAHFFITDKYIQIGPEQVLARIPTVKQKGGNTDREMWVAQAEFHPDEELMTTN